MTSIDIKIFLLMVALLDDDFLAALDDPRVRLPDIDIPVSLIVALWMIKKESLGDWLDVRTDAFLNQLVKEKSPEGYFEKIRPFHKAAYLRASDHKNPHGFPILRMGIHDDMRENIKVVRQYGRRLELYHSLKTAAGFRLLMLAIAHLKGSMSVTFLMPLPELIAVVAEGQKVNRWADFRRYVIDKAVEDININSPRCQITYRPQSNGHGKSVTHVQISLVVHDTENGLLIENSLTLSLVKHGVPEAEALRALGALGEPELRARLEAFERDMVDGTVEKAITDGKIKSPLHRLRAMLKQAWVGASAQNEYEKREAEKREQASSHKKDKIAGMKKRVADIVRQLNDMEFSFYEKVLPAMAAALSDDERDLVRKRITPAYLAEYDLHGVAFPFKAASNVPQRLSNVVSAISRDRSTLEAMARIAKEMTGSRVIGDYYQEQGVRKYDTLMDERKRLETDIANAENQAELF